MSLKQPGLLSRSKSRNNMKKIYILEGGGQRVRQNVGDTFYYLIVESSDWPEKSQSCGQSNYTRIWDTDFTSFKKEVEAWAGRRVKLCLSEEESN